MEQTETEWISPLEAVDRLSAVFKNLGEAKAVVAEALRDGRLDATAEYLPRFADQLPPGSTAHLQTATKPRSNTVFVLQGMRRTPQRYPVDPAVWHRSVDWDSDQRKWDWRTATFTVSTGTTSITVCNVAVSTRGVELVHSRSSQELANDIPPVRASNRAGIGGAPRASDWDLWIAEVAALVDEDQYQLGWSANKLYGKLRERLEKQGAPVPDYSKVESAMRAIKRRLAESRLK